MILIVFPCLVFPRLLQCSCLLLALHLTQGQRGGSVQKFNFFYLHFAVYVHVYFSPKQTLYIFVLMTNFFAAFSVFLATSSDRDVPTRGACLLLVHRGMSSIIRQFPDFHTFFDILMEFEQISTFTFSFRVRPLITLDERPRNVAAASENR